MYLSDLSIRRPVLATMMTAVIVVFGIVSYNRLGIDLFPDVEFPIVTVTSVLPGADPETIETSVTDVLEEAVNTISGIKKLMSQSTEGVSLVIVEFELKEDLDVKAQEVRDKVSAARAQLPLELEPPLVEKMDLDSMPIITVVLSGEGYPIRRLTDYADKVLKERLQRISGVGGVKILGGREREIRVWVDPARLEARLLTVQDVIDALHEQNVEIPGGRVETGPREYVVKTQAKIARVEDFEHVVVAHRDGADVLLSDVARVEDGLEDQRSLAILNGQPAIGLEVRRQSGTNMVAITDRVIAEVERLRADLPPGMSLVIAADNAEFIRQSIDKVKEDLLLGGLLAIAVVFLFLRSGRSTMVVAIVIPTSIIGAVACIWACGFTFNRLTLLALTLSVGILIDDAIVMVENIYRHIEKGLSPMAAALAGSSQIAFAVVSASLSLLAVFVPVAFMEGMVGQFFFEFGLTMSFVIIISTFIALTLSPMLCSRLLRRQSRHNALFNFMERIFVRIEGVYGRLLRGALGHPALTLFIALGIFVGGMGILPLLGMEFAAQEDESEFQVGVQAPTGSSLEYTRGILTGIAAMIAEYPGVTDTYISVGGGAQEKVNEGRIHVKLTPKSRRDYRQQELMARLRQRLAPLPGIKTSIGELERISGGGWRTQLVQYNIRGPNLEQLDHYAQALLSELRATPGFVDLDTTFESGKPEVRLSIDRRKASDLGVKIEDLARVTRNLVGGVDATKFEADGDQYDVRVRALGPFRDHPEALLALLVRSTHGSLVRFSNLTSIDIGVGPTQIDREARQRQITVLANLEDMPLGTAVEIVNRKVAAMDLPADYQTEFTGMADIMAESFQNITFALFLAIIIIYMVLAAQFEAYTHPFTVMLTVPLAVVGAFLGLLITGRTLSIFAMIGLIVLVGIVTKNAILLIDYTNQLRREGGMSKREALLAACPVRLRPILMTAASTIAGATPVVLGYGVGAESNAPMGTVIAFGLFLATLLTLLVVPVVYSLLDSLVSRLRPGGGEKAAA